MTRLVINYIATILLACLISICILFTTAWMYQTEFNFPQSLKNLIEVTQSDQLLPVDSSNPNSNVQEFSLGTATRFSPDQAAEMIERQESQGDHLILVKSKKDNDAVLLRLDQRLLDQAIGREDNLLLLMAMSSLFVFGLAGVLLAVPLVRKLQQQEAVIQKLASGDLTARTKHDSNDAVGRLGRRINDMANRLESLIDGQKELLRTVSHELRTPVNRLHFLLELLEKDIETGASTASSRITEIRDDLIQQDKLIDELLTYSRLDTITEPERTEIDWQEIVNNLTRQFSLQFLDIQYEFDFSPAVESVAVDPRLMHRLMSNLLSNAFKNAKSKVVIKILAIENGVLISVSDDGPGIRETEKSRVFEPFVKLNQHSGTGLGLAICKRIVDAHSGQIEFIDEAPGAHCRVILPATIK